MSKSTQHPKWVNTSDKGQVQRSTYVNEVRNRISKRNGSHNPLERFLIVEDESACLIERFIMGATLLALSKELMDDPNPEMIGVTGITDLITTNIAVTLQSWVKTGNDDEIKVPLQMIMIALYRLNELVKTEQ